MISKHATEAAVLMLVVTRYGVLAGAIIGFLTFLFSVNFTLSLAVAYIVTALIAAGAPVIARNIQ